MGEQVHAIPLRTTGPFWDLSLIVAFPPLPDHHQVYRCPCCPTSELRMRRAEASLLTQCDGHSRVLRRENAFVHSTQYQGN